MGALESSNEISTGLTLAMTLTQRNIFPRVAEDFGPGLCH